MQRGLKCCTEVCKVVGNGLDIAGIRSSLAKDLCSRKNAFLTNLNNLLRNNSNWNYTFCTFAIRPRSCSTCRLIDSSLISISNVHPQSCPIPLIFLLSSAKWFYQIPILTFTIIWASLQWMYRINRPMYFISVLRRATFDISFRFTAKKCGKTLKVHSQWYLVGTWAGAQAIFYLFQKPARLAATSWIRTRAAKSSARPFARMNPDYKL